MPGKRDRPVQHGKPIVKTLYGGAQRIFDYGPKACCSARLPTNSRGCGALAASQTHCSIDGNGRSCISAIRLEFVIAAASNGDPGRKPRTKMNCATRLVASLRFSANGV